jgi:hypothetical protein
VVESAFGDELHKKQAMSVAYAALGIIHGGTLKVASIGRALAQARSGDAKHAIKQVDRLLSNERLDVAAQQAKWVSFIAANRKEWLVALDWTDFNSDNHTTLALNVITRHGRATPLMWKTVKKSELKERRNLHEDELLERFRDALPMDVKVTVLADRGFGDKLLYDDLANDLRFSFIIRFRGSIIVGDGKGERKPAKEWLASLGRLRVIRNATVTATGAPIGAVVIVKSKGMKEPRFLACRDPEIMARGAVRLYGRRFTIEENFRDAKNEYLGMALSASRIKSAGRRDRLLLVNALATAMMTSLGAAGESLGWDRKLKANTSKKRTHSLFFQGSYYYGALRTMPLERAEPLLRHFGELVLQHAILTEMLGVI